MQNPLDTFLDQWERAYAIDQELEAQGVPPEAEERRRLMATLDACDAQITALAAAQADPLRDALDYTLPPRPLVRPQALWQKIN